MPNVVDELVVILNLDASQFTASQKRALESFRRTKEDAATTAKDLEARGKQAGEFYGQINRQALGLIATLAGAGTLGKFVSNTVTSIAAVGRASKVIGDSVQNTQAMRLTIQRMGGDADSATQSFVNLSQALERYNLGLGIDPTTLMALQQVGASANETPLQILRQLSQYSVGRNPKQVETYGANLGFTQDQINEALKGPKQFDADMAQSLKSVPTDAQVKKVTDLQAAFNGLKNSVTGAAQAMVEDAAPSLTGLLNIVTAGTLKFPELTKVVLAYLAALIAINNLKLVGGGFGLISKLGGGAPKVAPGVVGGAIGRTIGAAGILAFVPDQIRDTISELKGPEAWAADERARLGIKAPAASAQAPVSARASHPAASAAPAAKLSGMARYVQLTNDFARRLGITTDRAAGMVSDMAAESGGQAINEKHPVVKGKPGGFGLIQWTNSGGIPRRDHFFKWVKAHNLDPHSDAAQEGFLTAEMMGSPFGRAILEQIRSAASPSDAAAAMFKWVSGGNSGLQHHLGDHTQMANRIAAATRAANASTTTISISNINLNGVGITDARSFAVAVRKTINNVQLANQANGALN